MTYCLFSGGKDSMTTACFLSEQKRLEGLVFLDTGISTPDILPFVEQIASENSWPIEIYRTPVLFETLVFKYGFARPKSHKWFRDYLKGRCLRQFRNRHPLASLASGVRYAESKKRLGSVRPVSLWEGVRVEAPIRDWTTEQVWQYLRERDLKVSPAYSALHISGDCLCGAFADQTEKELLRVFYPYPYSRIRELEQVTGSIWGGKQADPCLACEA